MLQGMVQYETLVGFLLMFLGVILSSKSKVGKIVRSITGAAAMVDDFKKMWVSLK
jgi:hypothetical protein